LVDITPEEFSEYLRDSSGKAPDKELLLPARAPIHILFLLSLSIMFGEYRALILCYKGNSLKGSVKAFREDEILKSRILKWSMKKM